MHTGSDGEDGTAIKYSNTIFETFGLELETNHTFGEGTKLTITNGALIPDVGIKLESEKSESGEFEHAVSAEYQMEGGPLFSFMSFRGLFNFANRSIEAEV